MKHMLNNSQILGQIGENNAEMFLVKHDFSILCRNYRKRYGEIDIVAERFGIVHFVEVKSVSRVTICTNSVINSHRAEDNVDRRKITKLEKMSQIYMDENNIKDKNFQIDLITVILFKSESEKAGEIKPYIKYFPNVNL